MSYYADNIKRIARQRENKAGVGTAKERTDLPGSTKAMVDAPQAVDEGGLESPLQITILTYDDTKDVIIEDTSAVLHTIKTAATAKIVDANGKELLVDEIVFTSPP